MKSVKKIGFTLMTGMLFSSHSMLAYSADYVTAVSPQENHRDPPQSAMSEQSVQQTPAAPAERAGEVIPSAGAPPEGRTENEVEKDRPGLNKANDNNEAIRANDERLANLTARLDNLQLALRENSCNEANISNQDNASALLLTRLACVEENLLKLHDEIARLSLASDAPVKLDTALQQQAYASGVALAYTIKHSMQTQAAYQIKLEPKLVLAGINDVFNQKPLRMDEKSIQAAMEDLNQAIQKKIKEAGEQQVKKDAAAENNNANIPDDRK
jgi:hypothetical protein